MEWLSVFSQFVLLGENLLTGTIPSEMETLPVLAAIHLHGNDFTGDILTSLFAMPRTIHFRWWMLGQIVWLKSLALVAHFVVTMYSVATIPLEMVNGVVRTRLCHEK